MYKKCPLTSFVHHPKRLSADVFNGKAGFRQLPGQIPSRYVNDVVQVVLQFGSCLVHFLRSCPDGGVILSDEVGDGRIPLLFFLLLLVVILT